MKQELVQLSFDKILQARTYTVIILVCQENSPSDLQEKRFAIYVEPSIGKTLQNILTGAEKSRPQTHDLLGQILSTLSMRVKQIVICDLQETTYFARLFLERELDSEIRHVMEFDARPSDCLILALLNNAPIFCTHEVAEKAIHVED